MISSNRAVESACLFTSLFLMIVALLGLKFRLLYLIKFSALIFLILVGAWAANPLLIEFYQTLSILKVGKVESAADRTVTPHCAVYV